MSTAVLSVKLLRQILVDYNYWPESESDSALKISRSKVALTNEAIIALDASMRRAAMKEGGATTYKAAMQVEYKTLTEVFNPKIQASISEITAANVPGRMVESLVAPVQRLEFLVQLFAAFKQLANTKVAYVRDVAAPLAPKPTIKLSFANDKVTATIENQPKGSVLQFAFTNGAGIYELIKSDSSSPFDLKIAKSGLLRVDLVNANGYSLATNQLQVTYTGTAIPIPGNMVNVPLPVPATPFANDAYTGFFIIGESTDGETIVAKTLLTQT